MSVTDKTCQQGEQALPVTYSSVTDRAYDHCYLEIPVTGKPPVITCWKCKKEADHPHIIIKQMSTPFGTGHPVRVMCKSCGEKEANNSYRFEYGLATWLDVRCDNCGRGIRVNSYDRWRQWVFCCDRCRKDFYNRRDKETRDRKRGLCDCQVCGLMFIPKRADSKYCSSKCRQKAYRERSA